MAKLQWHFAFPTITHVAAIVSSPAQSAIQSPHLIADVGINLAGLLQHEIIPPKPFVTEVDEQEGQRDRAGNDGEDAKFFHRL